MTLTQYSGQLAAILATNRKNVKLGAGGPTNVESGGLQRIGYLTSNAGTTNVCYYDPATDTIYYDTGNPVISQE